jgi:hypothetical protein
MRRSLTYLAAWAAVTALAVSLSWVGVRHVLRGTVYDRPGAATAVGPVIHGSPSPPPTITVSTTPAARPTGPSPIATRSAGRAAAPPKAGARRPSATRTADIRSFSSQGGRAAWEFLESSARLVSATPNAGYATQVSQSPGWKRVDFTNGSHTSSIIASWFEHPPMVEVYEYAN